MKRHDPHLSTVREMRRSEKYGPQAEMFARGAISHLVKKITVLWVREKQAGVCVVSTYLLARLLA